MTYINTKAIMNCDTITSKHIVAAKQIENNIIILEEATCVKFTESKERDNPDDVFCVLKYDIRTNKFYYRDTIIKEFKEVPYHFWTNQILLHISINFTFHYCND